MKSGLRKRPTPTGKSTFIVEYIAYGQETIQYPDRLAKFMRNHPYLTQLDGEGMMEMQEQQENAWKAQEKEYRIKMLKTDRSAPEMRTTRDASESADIISDEVWDRRVREATDEIEAQSTFIQNQYNRDKQRDSINQTMDYELRRIGRAGDVAHAMSDGDYSDAMSSFGVSSSSRASSKSSLSSNVGGPSSSSGGPPPAAGASMAGMIGNAIKLGGRGAMEVARFGGEVGGALRDNINVFGGAATNAMLALDLNHRSRSDEDDNPRGRPRSTGGRAQRTPAIPREAPQVFNIATPVATPRPRSRTPAQPRTRTPARTPSDIQEGITGGSGTRLLRESRAGEHVKRAARAIVTAGRFSRTGR